MMKKISSLLLLTVFGLMMACQQKPTKSMEETSNSIFKMKTVLVDTRTAFLYASFHIPGSVNLVSSDFLMLKNPATKKYILDPDLNDVIDRLARKGLAPGVRVILISNSKNSDENKKWNWLLRNLGFEDIEMTSIEEFNAKNKNARFSDPERADVWTLKQSEQLQNEFILKKGNDCFVKFNDKLCS